MKHKSSVFFKYLFYVSFFIVAIIYIFPIMWAILTSFKTSSELMELPPSIFPDNIFNIRNYVELFNRTPFALFMLNSLIISLFSVLFSLLLSSLAGYGFAKFNFFGKGFMFFGILAVLMVPIQSIGLGLFVWIKRLGLIDTYAGLMLPLLVSAFGVLLMRESIATIPDDYIEAARIDGASELLIFTKIILPMIKPALATLGIIKFLWTWNTYFWPLLVIQDISKAPVTVGLAFFENMYFKEYNLISAGAVLSLAPIIIAFLFLRKWMIEALSSGGLKG